MAAELWLHKPEDHTADVCQFRDHASYCSRMVRLDPEQVVWPEGTWGDGYHPDITVQDFIDALDQEET